MANWHAGGLCNFTTHRFKKPVNYIRAPVLSSWEYVLISNAALTSRGFVVDVHHLAYVESTRGWVALMRGVCVNVAV